MKRLLPILYLIMNLCFAASVATSGVATPGALAQTTKVSGHIFDSDSQKPLSGVSVSVKGRNTGTITNAEGYFELKTNTPTTLIISLGSFRLNSSTIFVNRFSSGARFVFTAL